MRSKAGCNDYDNVVDSCSRELQTSVHGEKHLCMVLGTVHVKQSLEIMLHFKTRTESHAT